MAKTIEEIKQEIKEDINELVKSFEEYSKEGFKLTEIIKFSFEGGTRLVEAVENVQGISGEQKKEVVISSVKEIYKKVNPDIPYIPEPFETWMEDLLLDKGLNEFVDFIVGKYKEKGIFK
jgi:uncharacterized protein YicC (UPF0701 family)